MGARTGQQFLEGLRGDGRSIWLGGERVEDATEHPAFAGAARALARLFDLQHERADVCLEKDPETSELVGVSHMIPRSVEDLQRRRRCLETIAEATVGLVGRSPDYLNVTFAGFAGSAGQWAQFGNEEGAENLVRYQRKLAREDLALTHTIVQTTIDIGRDGDFAKAGADVPLQKIHETEHGIVVRGSKVLATLAPFSDELAVYPGPPADGLAVEFTSVPTVDTLSVEGWDLTPAVITKDENTVLVGAITLTVDANAATLTSVTIRLTGTATTADITGATLYWDADMDGTFDLATDFFAGSGLFGGVPPTATATFAPRLISAGTPDRLWVTYSCPCAAKARRP